MGKLYELLSSKQREVLKELPKKVEKEKQQQQERIGKIVNRVYEGIGITQKNEVKIDEKKLEQFRNEIEDVFNEIFKQEQQQKKDEMLSLKLETIKKSSLFPKFELSDLEKRVEQRPVYNLFLIEGIEAGTALSYIPVGQGKAEVVVIPSLPENVEIDSKLDFEKKYSVRILREVRKMNKETGKETGFFFGEIVKREDLLKEGKEELKLAA